MNARTARYRRRRFPPEIISYSVWAYHRFALSFRDVEDLLEERGIIASYESIRRWCLKFGPSVCEQPSGGLAPTDAAARTPDASLQIALPGATMPIPSRTCEQFLPLRPPSAPSRQPSAVPGERLRSVAAGSVCLKHRDRITPVSLLWPTTVKLTMPFGRGRHQWMSG